MAKNGTTSRRGNLAPAKHQESGQRHVRIKARILKIARALEPNQPLPPRPQLLKELNVARGTITRVIQELQSEGILVVRKGSGVYTTPLAKLTPIAFVARWKMFGLPPFSQVLLDALIKHAPEYGMALEPHLIGDDQRPDPARSDAFFQAVAAKRYAGLITAESEIGVWWSNQLRQLGLPIVAFGFVSEAPNAVVYRHDDIPKLGVKMLAEHGVKKIALMDWTHQEVKRSPLFRQILEQHGLEYRTEWDLAFFGVQPLELIGYRGFMKAWNQWTSKPEGIICANDQLTTGMIQAAADLGVQIPSRLKIVSHANRGLTAFNVPGIFRLDLDLDLIARTLLDRMRKQLAGADTAGPVAVPLIPSLSD